MGGHTVKGTDEAECLLRSLSSRKRQMMVGEKGVGTSDQFFGNLQRQEALIKRGGHQSKCQDSTGYLQVPSGWILRFFIFA